MSIVQEVKLALESNEEWDEQRLKQWLQQAQLDTRYFGIRFVSDNEFVIDRREF